MGVHSEVGGAFGVVANAAAYAYDQHQRQQQAHRQHRHAVGQQIMRLGAEELARRLQAANAEIARLNSVIRVLEGEGDLDDLEAL